MPDEEIQPSTDIVDPTDDAERNDQDDVAEQGIPAESIEGDRRRPLSIWGSRKELRRVSRQSPTGISQSVTGSTVGGHVISIRDVGGDITIIHGLEGEAAEVKRIFVDTLRDRSTFLEKMHRQALQQANFNYVIYTIFAILGCVAVLAAAVLALVDRTDTTQSISLVSGLGGILVGTCGAALAYRADQARKHLAAQGEKVHDQLLMERRLAEAAELVAGIKNEEIGDRARISLALRILNEGKSEVATPESNSDPNPTSN